MCTRQMLITNLWHVVWHKSFLTTLTTILTSSFLERKIAVVLLYKIDSVIKSVGKLQIWDRGGVSRSLQTRPLQKNRCSLPTRFVIGPQLPLQRKIPVQRCKNLTRFYPWYFLFHVSFSVLKALVINSLVEWNMSSECFIFSFNVSSLYWPIKK